ncbi:MAG: tetratricopeptide repeat protein [bacterium]|nr:tetratricopeptide repeat protein [bacterium]
MKTWAWVLLPLILTGWWAALVYQADSSVFARVPLLDEQQYLSEAYLHLNQEMAGDESVNRPFFMSPLYPKILAGLGVGYESSKDLVLPTGALQRVYLFNIFCWVATLVLLRLLAGRLAPELSGKMLWFLWLPSFLVAFYLPLSIYTMMALVEVPLVFFITLYFFLLGSKQHRLLSALAAGLVLGLAVLLRGSTLVLAPLGVWALIRSGRSRAWLSVGMHLLIMVLVLLPPTIHNSKLSGHLSPPSLNSGLNLYLGNGPAATGMGTSLEGDWLTDPAGCSSLQQRLGGEPVSILEADSLWRELAFNTIRENPARFVQMWFRKMHLQTQAFELDQVTSFHGWQQDVSLLKYLFIPWWLIVALALVGAGAVLRKGARAETRWLAVALLVLMAAQSLFFVVSRYRMVLLPALALLALVGLLELKQGFFSKRGLSRQTIAIVTVALLLIIPWGLAAPLKAWRPLAVANHAQRWAILGAVEQDPDSYERAAGLYQLAVDQSPKQAAPYLGYVSVLREQGHETRADEILMMGARTAAPNLVLGRAVVASHLQAGREAKALEEAFILLDDFPGDFETLHNVVVLLSRAGRKEEALFAAKQLVAHHPEQAQGYLDLGVLLARSGQKDQAKAVFERGLVQEPNNKFLRENLSRLQR